MLVFVMGKPQPDPHPVDPPSSRVARLADILDKFGQDNVDLRPDGSLWVGTAIGAYHYAPAE